MELQGCTQHGPHSTRALYCTPLKKKGKRREAVNLLLFSVLGKTFGYCSPDGSQFCIKSNIH